MIKVTIELWAWSLSYLILPVFPVLPLLPVFPVLLLPPLLLFGLVCCTTQTPFWYVFLISQQFPITEDCPLMQLRHRPLAVLRLAQNWFTGWHRPWLSTYIPEGQVRQGKLGFGPVQATQAPETNCEFAEHVVHWRNTFSARQFLGRSAHWLLMSTWFWLQLAGATIQTPFESTCPTGQTGVRMQRPLSTWNPLLQLMQTPAAKLYIWQLLELRMIVQSPLYRL